MATPEHVRAAQEGWESIDYWRNEHPTGALNLSGATIVGVDLTSHAYSYNKDKGWAPFHQANLKGAILKRTRLSKQNLIGADLRGADLTDADLSETALDNADLTGANLHGTILRNATFSQTNLANTDLSHVSGLETVRHRGPSILSLETLRNLKGCISLGTELFLRGCGLNPWEIELTRLYDQALTAGEIAEIISVQLFGKRTDGPLYIGGIFISYSHADSQFADKLYSHFYNSGASVWLDRHDVLAGDLHKQIAREIRLRDVVVMVLSSASVSSDWVEHELRWARERERQEDRDILCPISLDDSWKEKMNDVLWAQLGKKAVLDFSDLGEKEFETQFDRLLRGIKQNYGKR